MTPRLLITTLLAASTIHVYAAPRLWKSADGQRQFKGEFVKRDAKSVTIRRTANFEEVTLPFDQFHKEDQTWLNANHPLPGTKKPAPPSAQLPGPATGSTIIDQLAYGDNRNTVTQKLKASKFFKSNVADALMGRTGLNGVFVTREKIGGLEASLYFDWDDNGGLKEITIQTDPLPAKDLDEHLTPCWKEYSTQLSTLFGSPLSAHDQFSLDSVRDGTMTPTHLWKHKNSGSVLLGVARDGSRYQIAVRFTNRNVMAGQ